MIDLVQHFPSHWEPLVKCASIDWGAANVDRKYYILTTGRSGSTHLVDLLLATRRVGWPQEYFNEGSFKNLTEAHESSSFCNYIQAVAERRQSGGCFGFKIDIWRLESLLQLVHFPVLFPPSDTALLVMTRKDKVEQAYSFAVARAMSVWHSVGKDTVERDHIPSDEDLWKEINLVCEAEARIERYIRLSGRDALRFTYEDLIASREEILQRCLSHIGIEPNVKHHKPVPEEFAVRKISYNGRDRRIAEFKSKFDPVLNEIEDIQEGYDWKAVSARLLDEFNLSL